MTWRVARSNMHAKIVRGANAATTGVRRMLTRGRKNVHGRVAVTYAPNAPAAVSAFSPVLGALPDGGV